MELSLRRAMNRAVHNARERILTEFIVKLLVSRNLKVLSTDGRDTELVIGGIHFIVTVTEVPA